MVILGLDASTSTIGWSFYDHETKSILECGFVDISKEETHREKSYKFIDFIRGFDHISKTKRIVLEAALSGFAGGFTRQQVIIKLVRWNAVFHYILTEEFKDSDVQLVGVNTLRKSVFGKCRIKDVKSKEFVKMQLDAIFPDIDKLGISNKRGNPDKRNSDMHDAIVCSMYSIKS